MNDVILTSDRLNARGRPKGWPVMYQSWGQLLFMHWPLSADELRPHIPESLGIDTFRGSAWVAITPFSLWNVRPIFIPPVPFVSQFHEINVRTYVYYENVPGVWFFSLDASSLLAVVGARLLYSLPYHHAAMTAKRMEDRIDFRSTRFSSRLGNFTAGWTITNGERLRSEPGSLEFFLTERYCLYTESSGDVYRCRIHHQPWELGQARIENYETDLFVANRLPVPAGAPLLHAAGPVDVEIWGLERITNQE